MRVGQRLILAVVPAIIGLFTVAALAYWGRLDRSAPQWLIIVTAVATLLSLAVAWQNTRYVARRIERLAGAGDRPGGTTRSPLTLVRNAALPRDGAAPDEIDSIERVVDRLSSAVTVAETGSRQREAAATERVQEYAALLAETASAVSRQLDEIRLPIHILLENHFGQLNENQEEMLASARAAAEAAGVELSRLREIAELDRGALNFRRDRVRVGDLLQALKPQLEADGERTGVDVTIDVVPGLPPVAGDRVRLQEALELLLRHLVRHALPGTAVSIGAARDKGEISIDVTHGPAPMLDANVALGQRIILAHGGRIEQQEGRTRIILPASSVSMLPASS
ncbi:MAG: sensor histidine kinase [Gemmatimonadales bacterium]